MYRNIYIYIYINLFFETLSEQLKLNIYFLYKKLFELYKSKYK